MQGKSAMIRFINLFYYVFIFVPGELITNGKEGLHHDKDTGCGR